MSMVTLFRERKLRHGRKDLSPASREWHCRCLSRLEKTRPLGTETLLSDRRIVEPDTGCRSLMLLVDAMNDDGYCSSGDAAARIGNRVREAISG